MSAWVARNVRVTKEFSRSHFANNDGFVDDDTISRMEKKIFNEIPFVVISLCHAQLNGALSLLNS